MSKSKKTMFFPTLVFDFTATTPNSSVSNWKKKHGCFVAVWGIYTKDFHTESEIKQGTLINDGIYCVDNDKKWQNNYWWYKGNLPPVADKVFYIPRYFTAQAKILGNTYKDSIELKLSNNLIATMNWWDMYKLLGKTAIANKETVEAIDWEFSKKGTEMKVEPV